MRTSNCRTIVSRYEFPLAIAFYPNYSTMLSVTQSSPSSSSNLTLLEAIMRDNIQNNYGKDFALSLLDNAYEISNFQGTLNNDEIIELGYYSLWATYKAGQYWDFNHWSDICGFDNLSSSVARSIVMVPGANSGTFVLNVFLEGLDLAEYPNTMDVVLGGLNQYIADSMELIER